MHYAGPVHKEKSFVQRICTTIGPADNNSQRWVRTMLLKHFSALVAATLIAMTFVGSVSAQQNLGQAFAPVSYDQFGGGKRANEGWFVDYSGVYWYVPRANNTLIGSNIQQSTWEWNEYLYGAPAMPEDGSVATLGGILAPTGSQTSSATTHMVDSDWSIGQRISAGAVSGHHGFEVGWMYLNLNTEAATAKNVPFVLEQTGTVGGYPMLTPNGWIALDKMGATGKVNNDIPSAITRFDSMTVSTKDEFWTVNANYFYRLHPVSDFITELSLGGRYTQFNEEFWMTGKGGWLHNSNIHATAKNNLAGPSAGVRFSRSVKQWTFNAQAAYTAAFNTRSVGLDGSLKNLLDDPRITVDPTSGEITVDETTTSTSSSSSSTSSSTTTTDDAESARDYIEAEENALPDNIESMNALNGPSTAAFPSGTISAFTRERNEFSSMIDWRLDTSYQVTKMISLNVGYSGMWVNDVVRPAEQIDYSIGTDHYLGIKKFELEDLWLQGVDFGITLNR